MYRKIYSHANSIRVLMMMMMMILSGFHVLCFSKDTAVRVIIHIYICK